MITAQSRAERRWSEIRLLGADHIPGFAQANLFQEMKKYLPDLQAAWVKQGWKGMDTKVIDVEPEKAD